MYFFFLDANNFFTCSGNTIKHGVTIYVKIAENDSPYTIHCANGAQKVVVKEL